MTVATLEFENLEFSMASEMDSTETKVPTTFNLSPHFDVDEITGNDDSDDKFIYAYTVSGVSKNSRNWTPDVVRSIGQQVLDKLPVGHLGHIRPADAGFVLPDPQVVWFGSAEEALDNNVIRMWLKGYVLPTAEKAKVWIKSKAINSISVWGKVNYVQNGAISEITDVDLKSIDLSRKLGEGLPAFIASIAGEQEEVSVVPQEEKIEVGEALEMDGSLDSLLEAIRGSFNDYRRELQTNGTINENDYIWVRKVYNDFVIAKGENEQCYKIPYEIDKNDDITFGELIPVVKKVKYIEKTAVAGEQEQEEYYEEVEVQEMTGKWSCDKHKTKAECKKAKCKNCTTEEEAGEMAMTQAIAKLTLSDIKLHNPQLFDAIKAEITEEIKFAKKEETAVAGEQAGLIQGQGVATGLSRIAKVLKMPSYAGEQEGTVEPSLDEVVAHATQIVATNEELTATTAKIEEIVEPLKADGEETTETISNLVTAKVVADNQQAITNVLAKFDELTANVENEVLLDYIKDEFNAILAVDAESLEEDYEEKALKLLEENLEAVISKHVERFNKLTANSSLAGEMNAVASFNLGNNLPTADKVKTDDELSPEELATKYGY